MKKKLGFEAYFSSLFGQPRWLCAITITGFSSWKPETNRKFLNSIIRLVEKYNRSEEKSR